LFQVMLTLQQAGRETSRPEELRRDGSGNGIEPMGRAQAVHFDLTLTLTDLGGEMAGAVEYSLDLFEDGTIERLLGHYTNLLDEIIRHGERPISELSVLSAEEREQVVLGWNETAKRYDEELCLHQL